MGAGQTFTTQIDARNDVARIALSGELDMATVPLLNDQLAALEQDGSKVILLDLRDLNFIDSSGIQAFVQAHTRSGTNGHRFVLVGASPTAQRLFEMTGTEFLLEAPRATQLVGLFTGDGSQTSDQEASTEAHV